MYTVVCHTVLKDWKINHKASKRFNIDCYRRDFIFTFTVVSRLYCSNLFHSDLNKSPTQPRCSFSPSCSAHAVVLIMRPSLLLFCWLGGILINIMTDFISNRDNVVSVQTYNVNPVLGL